MLSSVVVGTGSYLPAKIVTNDELSKTVDTSDEWIRQRTGITQRHIAAEGQKTSDLAVEAARNAMRSAGVEIDDIDLIVVATATPDETFPSTATIVQAKLGMHHGAAFDVAAVCTGFVYAITVADGLLKTGAHKRALVIGAETLSRILDWEDRTTCVLFGDGAGAVVLEARENAEGQGILASILRSDGGYHDLLFVDGGPSSTGTVGKLRMQGQEVFKLAVGKISGIIIDVLDKVGLKVDDVDWFIPHQANQRIIEATARKVGLPIERTVSTIAAHANTSAASIPLAIHHAVTEKSIKKGDLVLLEAMGGGFTWGAVLLRW